MKLYVISPGVPPDAITEALLPARYYLYLSQDWARVHLESWGSWIEGGADAYHEALQSLALPYDVFRFGEEPSHRVEVAKIIKWDVETGRRSSGWRYSLKEED